MKRQKDKYKPPEVHATEEKTLTGTSECQGRRKTKQTVSRKTQSRQELFLLLNSWPNPLPNFCLFNSGINTLQFNRTIDTGA